MISIKYDFPPPTRTRARSIVFLSRGPLHLRRSFRTGFSLLSLSLSHFPPSPSHPFNSLSPRGGITQGLTHSLIISSQCTVRNSLVTRTRTHVHRGPASPPSPSPLFHALARSSARSGARWRSPIIRFHRIFVVRAQASAPDTNPPINPVSVWGIRN